MRRVVLGLTLLVFGGVAALALASDPSSMSSSILPAIGSNGRPQTPLARPGVSASPSPSAVRSPVASTPAEPEVVAVGSRTDGKLSLIDPVTGKVSGTVDVGMAVQSMTLAPDGQTAWVFSSTPTETDFAVVDLVRGARTDTRRLRLNPTAAAFSSDGRRAYVALGGGHESPPPASSVLFLDASNANELGHVDVGQQSPGVQIQRRLSAVGVAPGSGGDVVYAAGYASGAVWALDGGNGTLVQQIETGGGPIAVLPDPAHRRVYVLADTTNELVAIDATHQTILNRLSLPGKPTGAALAPNGTLYISGGDMAQVWPVDLGNWRMGPPIRVGAQPAGLAISLDGARAYVALSESGSLAILDLARNQVTSTIAAGKDAAVVLVGRSRQSTSPRPSPPRPAQALAGAPTPTPQPQTGSQIPDHLPAGAVSDTFMPADFPVSVAFAPDGTLFYNELHTGKIRVVRNGTLLPDPFYQFKVSGEPEAGLIGLVLDPDFQTNHYVYVFYTSVPDDQDNGGPNGPNQLVRLTDVSDKGTQLTSILRDLPSGPIHNSGTLRFGPDGKLYVTIGDNDHGANAQDLTTLAGKVLRVNPDGTVPDDNPFVGQPGKQGAIWAYGFRNPFSFAFDPLRHGLFLTQNGPGDNDELDFIQKGGNYGWPPTGYKYTPGVVDPIAVLNPPIGPTGTVFYTGDQVPSWKYDWFYCNYHQGQLRRVRLAPESRDRIVFEEVVKNGCGLGVANAPDGALYYMDAKGIYRLHKANATNLIPAVVDSAPSGAAPTPTAEVLPAGTRPEDRDVNVTLNEWKLEPSRTKVPSGQIRILAENTGATQHALRIVGAGIDVSTDDFAPGDSRTIQMMLPPGKYQMTCPVPGHEQQGMSATLTVVGQ